MVPVAIALSLFCFLMAAISWFGYHRYSRPGRFYKHLGSEAVVETNLGETPTPLGNMAVRGFEYVGQQLPISPQDAAVTRRYLIAAGFRSDMALAVHYGIKVVTCIAMVGGAFLLRDHITSIPLLRIVLVIAAGLAGYFGPNLVLEWLVSRRQERL